MSCDTTAEAVATPSVARREVKRRPELTVLTLLTLVVVLDQVTKWWAWRHVSTVRINVGGDLLVGPTVGRLYTNPVMGALLDLLDAGLLSRAAVMLIRSRQGTAQRTCGALVLAGWTSDLLDRLGMHYVTAPGSVRGAVDFIHIGRYYLNVADVFILGGTIAFLLVSGYRWLDKKLLARRGQALARPRPLRARGRLLAVAGGIGVVVVVALGAADPSGVTAPLPSTSASASR
jgi:lipoprotein signal peptidase